MPGSWSSTDFPYLDESSPIETSKKTRTYNCFAYAAKDNTKRWDPDPFFQYYWPPNVPRDHTLNSVLRVYKNQGYAECIDGSNEPGFEKIAIYAKTAHAGVIGTHAALQLESGEWTSKLGDLEDITHTTLDALNGPCYGTVVRFLKRAK
jgi:hypothetical protein